ncbi:hypothetical protein PVAND_010225 [Polypedilum vanderplanki]|uniref:DALR anticodon binding domain-containing protein n=1 Tax=Polypedilum vanderplanki TaxID=319348 RepID=A0A9J6CFQ5_POLVA|nr:hypothetical protein PVAND_010225 [Polypedilum vanderplanki]
MKLVATFKRQLLNYLFSTSNVDDNLISFETNSKCDFTFVRNYYIWCQHLDNEIDKDTLNNDDILFIATGKSNVNEAIEALIKESENWVFKIERVDYCEKKYFIQLHRSTSLKIALEEANSFDFSNVEKDDCETISIESEECDNGNLTITNFRLEVFESVLKNIIVHETKYVYVNDSSIAKHKLRLSSVSNIKTNKVKEEDEETEQSKQYVTVLCNSVLGTNNKKSEESAFDYFTRRRNDMHLIAIHKYGIRAKDDQDFVKMIEKLGRAAANLDMVEVKHSHALKLNSSSKQPFILYNSARLETLLANFDEKVKEGYYEEINALAEIDVSLLSEDLEWELLKLIHAYPETIQKSFNDIEKGKLGIQLLYKYLYSLVRTFSAYYSKVKILRENRSHLIPVVHAKIHLLRIFQKYFNHVLSIFNIEPVSFM